MVLYCCQHPASIIKAIVHKMNYYSNENATVITIRDGTEREVFFLPKLEGVNYLSLPNDFSKAFLKETDEDSLCKLCEDGISNFLRENNIDIKEFTTIIMSNDWFMPFALYCYMHKVTFDVILPAAFNIFNPTHNSSTAHATLQKRIHYYDNQSAFLEKYYFNLVAPLDKNINKPIISWSVPDGLKSLDTEQKEVLRRAYGIDEFDIKPITLIALNSAGYIGSSKNRYKFEFARASDKDYFTAYIEYYLVSIDYFFAPNYDDISVKLHIGSSDQKYKEAFQCFNKFIEDTIPLEVIALLQNIAQDVKYFSFNASTSMLVFKELGCQVTQLGEAYYPFFGTIHFVYAAFSIIKAVSPSPETIYVYGDRLPLDQLGYFRDYAFKTFKGVRFERLSNTNVKSAKYIIADETNNDFREITKDVSADCVIFVNGDVPQTGFTQRKMKYSLIDISSNAEKVLKDFAFCILSRNAKAVTDNFIISWDLKTAKIRVKVFPAESFIHSKPNDNPPTTTTATDTKQLDKLKGEIESLKRRKLLDTRYEQYLQMYYETERTGYTLRDYFEERGLFDAKVKLAFFAVDEFGIMVYRICERLGIKFTALVSDINRNIEFKTHGNTTESLPLESLANIDKSLYTNVFMATVWNGDQIEFVKKHCPRLFLFDAVMQSMYTRAFFINKIRALTEKNIGIKTGIFFTPYIHQIPGEHSELEEYFRQQGQKMSNIMNIQDEKLREKAKDACYRVYGFDDGYIESVCNFGYPIELHNGVYLMRDYSSKYVNVVNHRRLTTDTPEKYQNTIYFFGDSMVTGLHVGDAETIESNLQRIINDNNLPFCVQNCANSYGLKYDWIFTLADTMSFAPGDILLFCTRLDWLTEQYVKQNNKNLLQGALGVYTADAFKRPHEHGELFTDDHHNNGKGYGLIARKIFDELNQAGYFDVTSLQGGGETAAVQQLMVPPPHVPRS